MKHLIVVSEVSAEEIRAKNRKDVTDQARERCRVRRAIEDREAARALQKDLQPLQGASTLLHAVRES